MSTDVLTPADIQVDAAVFLAEILGEPANLDNEPIPAQQGRTRTDLLAAFVHVGGDPDNLNAGFISEITWAAYPLADQATTFFTGQPLVILGFAGSDHRLKVGCRGRSTNS